MGSFQLLLLLRVLGALAERLGQLVLSMQQGQARLCSTCTD